ncbi:ryanodine receptor 2 [Silurus meridionalis]|nr:ryanodine receptor 2 [Silurus meridionalis]
MVDRLAENAHNVWARDRIRQGWTYGIQQKQRFSLGSFVSKNMQVDWSSGEAVENWISANMAQTNSVTQNSNGETDDSPNTLVYRKHCGVIVAEDISERSVLSVRCWRWRVGESHSVLKSTECKAQWEHGTKQQQATKRKRCSYLKVEDFAWEEHKALQRLAECSESIGTSSNE